MDEAVDAAQIHEGAEVHDGGNGALETHAALELGEDLGALGLAGLLEHDATGQNDVVAVAVHLDDASLDGGAHVGGEVLHAAKVNEGGGQEAAQADVEDKTALDDLDNLALDVLAGVELLLDAVLHAAKVNEGGGQEAAQADVEDKTALDDLDNLALDVLAGVELLLDAVPSTLVLGTLLGEDQTTVLVLLLENEGLDGIADSDDVCRVSVLADGELAHGDNALGLESDVNEHLVALDLHDSAAYEIALIEIGDATVDKAVHLLFVYIVEGEDGRVLNLTQRWTPFELRGPDLLDLQMNACIG